MAYLINKRWLKPDQLNYKNNFKDEPITFCTSGIITHCRSGYFDRIDYKNGYITDSLQYEHTRQQGLSHLHTEVPCLIFGGEQDIAIIIPSVYKNLALNRKISNFHLSLPIKGSWDKRTTKSFEAWIEFFNKSKTKKAYGISDIFVTSKVFLPEFTDKKLPRQYDRNIKRYVKRMKDNLKIQ